MLAVGMADGNVAVYNLQKNCGKPTYISTAKNGKHQDMVWQVGCFVFDIDVFLFIAKHHFSNISISIMVNIRKIGIFPRARNGEVKQ